MISTCLFLGEIISQPLPQTRPSRSERRRRPQVDVAPFQVGRGGPGPDKVNSHIPLYRGSKFNNSWDDHSVCSSIRYSGMITLYR